MNGYCAIQGQLVDVRNVGTHKCVKLTIHVPAEYARKVIDAFGWATGVDPVPVAIARLGADTQSTTSTGGAKTKEIEPSAEDPPSPASTQTPAKAGKLAQDAGRICNEPAFWAFCRLDGCIVHNKEQAAEHVRAVCEVQTRRDIRPGTVAEQRWNLIASAYKAWLDGPKCGAA